MPNKDFVASRTPLRVAQDPGEIDNPILDFFLRYWNAKRGQRPMPSRADIRVRELKPHLGWVSLIDVLPEAKDFRFRLVGSHVSQYFLGDGTGKTLSEAFAQSPKAFVEHVFWIYRTVAQSARPLRISGPGASLRGQLFPDYDSLYLPLSDDGARATMVMSVFTFNYEEYRRTHSLHSLTHTTAG